MEKKLKNIQTFEQHTDKNLNISDVRSRLFAVMADDYIILKLFWKKEDAEKELEAYKNEHKGGMFFVDEVEVY
jgi:hypothetical protein